MLAINHFYNPLVSHVTVDITSICELMTDVIPEDRYFCCNVEKALASLEEKKYIVISRRYKKKGWYQIESESLFVDVKREKQHYYWIKCTVGNVRTIFNNVSGTKAFHVLNFYINLLRRISPRDKCVSIPLDTMIELWNISRGTILAYTEILENLKLIYVYRQNAIHADGTFHKLSNFYGRYEDREAVITHGNKSYINTDKIYLGKKLNRRSISNRYRMFLKGVKKYEDQDEVFKLMRMCEQYNESTTDDYIKQCEVDGRTALLDMDVFDKYMDGYKQWKED